MKSPNRTYSDLTIDGGQGLVLETSAGPFNSEVDTYDVSHVWLSGLKDGWPGFGRRGTMNTSQIRAYMGSERKPGKNGSPSRVRGVTLHSTYEGQRELTGIAVYGATANKAGLWQKEDRQLNPAHLPTFEVAGQTRGRRELSGEEMGLSLIALGYAVVLDAQNQGYDFISYNLEEVTKQEVNDALGRLDLTKEHWANNPDFAVDVLDVEAMQRGQWAVSLTEAEAALPGLYSWLHDSRSMEPRAEIEIS